MQTFTIWFLLIVWDDNLPFMCKFSNHCKLLLEILYFVHFLQCIKHLMYINTMHLNKMAHFYPLSGLYYRGQKLPFTVHTETIWFTDFFKLLCWIKNWGKKTVWKDHAGHANQQTKDFLTWQNKNKLKSESVHYKTNLQFFFFGYKYVCMNKFTAFSPSQVFKKWYFRWNYKWRMLGKYGILKIREILDNWCSPVQLVIIRYNTIYTHIHSTPIHPTIQDCISTIAKIIQPFRWNSAMGILLPN